MALYWLYRMKMDESGATAIEYALIAALIALAAIGGIAATGSPLEIMANKIVDAFP